MKEVLMMMLPYCPHCRKANALIEELYGENPAYKEVVIRRVDEEAEKAFADSLDYFYVPCFFVEGEKLLEGVPTKEKVKAVMDAALTE